MKSTCRSCFFSPVQTRPPCAAWILLNNICGWKREWNGFGSITASQRWRLTAMQPPQRDQLQLFHLFRLQLSNRAGMHRGALLISHPNTEERSFGMVLPYNKLNILPYVNIFYRKVFRFFRRASLCIPGCVIRPAGHFSHSSVSGIDTARRERERAKGQYYSGGCLCHAPFLLCGACALLYVRSHDHTHEYPQPACSMRARSRLRMPMRGRSSLQAV